MSEAAPVVDATDETAPRHRPGIAWIVHVFTSTGIIAGFLGLLSALDGSPRASLIWLMVAVVIDGLDGPIARHYDVGNAVPTIDGNTLDLVIDYVTCVIGPAFFMHQFDLLPREYNLSLIAIGLILVSSLYCFANTNLMTEDNYFNGFPAMWNFVVTIFFVTQSRPWVNLVVVAVFVALTFVPAQFMHPFRTRDFRKITVPVVTIWIAAQLWLTWIMGHRTHERACHHHCLGPVAQGAQTVVYLGTAWILFVGIWRTVRGPSRAANPDS
jgi:phosphatidylcholine synthase